MDLSYRCCFLTGLGSEMVFWSQYKIRVVKIFGSQIRGCWQVFLYIFLKIDRFRVSFQFLVRWQIKAGRRFLGQYSRYLFCWSYRFTSVIVFRAVFVSMLKSELGTLLETVAGIMIMGIQNFSCFFRVVDSFSSFKQVCRISVCSCGGGSGEQRGIEGLLKINMETRQYYRQVLVGF